jgi:acetyltransferase-like isoleucine patch superfamily enzyme
MLKPSKSSERSGGLNVKRFPDVEELILEKGVKIEEGVSIKGRKIAIREGTVLRRGTRIEVSEHLEIGRSSVIGESNQIRGRDIRIGREFYSNHDAEIGGGGCFERTSKLTIGYWFHLGSYSIVNTAMEVKIGNEVGMGRFTNVYTHGAYQSALDGFPVDFGPITIGNNVWIPGATILPNVTIGDNVVIGVGSLVSKNVPSGCLAAGVPCKVIRDNCYPRELPIEEKLRIIKQINNSWNLGMALQSDCTFRIDSAVIDFESMRFSGRSSEKSERARNILRRHGIRFKVDVVGNTYTEWIGSSDKSSTQ